MRSLRTVFAAGSIVVLLLILSSCENLIFIGSKTELVKAIPNNASFIVKISDPEIFQARLLERSYQTVVREKILPAELIENHKALKTFLSNGKYIEDGKKVAMLASLHLASASKLNSIHYFPLSISNKIYKRQLEENYPGAASQKWNYEGVDFHEVILTELNSKITIAFSHGILIMSPMPFLVEDAIKQLKSSKTLLSEPGFKKVYQKETDEADANIWMPFENSRHWMSLFASEEGMEILGPVNEVASWMLMDLYLNEDEIFLSGITSIDDGQRLAGLKGNATCNHILDEYTPFNTASYYHYSFMADSVSQSLNRFGLGGCWSRILIEPLNSSIGDHLIFLLPIEDEELLKASAETDEMKGAFANLFLHNQDAYYRRINDFVALSSNRHTLDNYLANIKSGQVLTRDETFLELKEDLKNDAQLTCYMRTMYHGETFQAVYENQAAAKADFKAFKGFNQLALQFSRQGDHFLTNATLTYSEEDGRSHTNLAWTIELAAPVLAGPKIVPLNDEGSKGILVQDMDFNLYLLDKSGNTLWKKELESKWMGSVYPLALFEGAGNAMAFNTETDWFLLDVDGQDMAGFPLHFKDQASAPLSLIKNKDEVFVFIPSRNGSLYGYELSGKPLPGWNPKEKTGMLRHAPQLVIEDDVLFITAIGDDGTAYVWNKQGRQKARNTFKTSFPSDHYLDLKADPFKVKNVKSNGELVSMNARGKVGRYKLPVSSINQFAMGNVHGNSDPEIILSSGSAIWLFSYQGKLIWKKNLPGSISVVDLPGDAAAIAVHDIASKSLQLLKADGGTYTSDPIEAGDHFCFTSEDLLGAGQPSFITSGSENELYCYRIALGN